MLQPHKHMNPDRSALNLSASILAHMQRARQEKYTKLIQIVKDKNQDGDTLFAASMSLLFLLGLVEYRAKTDSFEYTGP